MPERITSGEIAIVPNEVTTEWLADFNRRYANSDRTARFTVEDWLEQPSPEVKDVASSYYILRDAGGANGWEQQISGTVLYAAFTHLPRSVGGGFEPVLGLHNAERLLPDGTSVLLAQGAIVLINLENGSLRSDIAIEPAV